MEQTILIVDDSPDAVVLTELALAMLGLRIRTESASSGEEALERLKTGNQLPALVLLDLKMPGMGGIAALREMRSDGRLKGIPVVVTTHSILQSDFDAARDAGASGFIHKAIRIEDFSRDLEQHILRWIRVEPADGEKKPR